jgi:hypothetical protein
VGLGGLLLRSASTFVACIEKSGRCRTIALHQNPRMRGRIRSDLPISDRFVECRCAK